jgi:hypothetical protein
LIATFIGIGTAVMLYRQQPKQVDPPRTAPVMEITPEALKKELLKPAPAEQSSRGKSTDESPTTVLSQMNYLEDVTQLYRCSVKFATDTNAAVQDPQNAVAAARIEDLRSQIEKIASAPDRGTAWVKSAVKFTCQTLADPDIVAARRDQKISEVFRTTINFHIAAWDDAMQKRKKADADEQARVEKEQAAEEVRVAEAKAFAWQLLIVSAGAFATFMLLALYLLGAKIETNLRELSISAKSMAER